MTDLDTLPSDVIERILKFLQTIDLRNLFLVNKNLAEIAKSIIIKDNVLSIACIRMQPLGLPYRYILNFHNHWVITSNEDYKRHFNNIDVNRYIMINDTIKFNLKIVPGNTYYLMYIFNIHNGNCIKYQYPIYVDSYIHRLIFTGLYYKYSDFYCLKTKEIKKFIYKLLPRSVKQILDPTDLSDYYAVYLLECSLK